MTKWNFSPLTCPVEKLLSHWNPWLDFRLLKLVSLSGSGSANLPSGLSSGNYFCSIPPPPIQPGNIQSRPFGSLWCISFLLFLFMPSFPSCIYETHCVIVCFFFIHWLSFTDSWRGRHYSTIQALFGEWLLDLSWFVLRPSHLPLPFLCSLGLVICRLELLFWYQKSHLC